jgi:uncharacterized membrane protein
MAEQKSKQATRTRKRTDGAAADEPRKRRRAAKRQTSPETEGKEAADVTEADAKEALQEGPEAAPVGGAPQELESAERTVRDELRSVMREAAIEVLGPVTRKATTAAAKYAVTKGPELATKTVAPKIKDTLAPKVEEAGGPGELAKGALSKVSGAGGGLLSKIGIGGDGAEGPAGTGKGRRLPVQESVDVAVPLETAYNQWTQFEDFPKFMHRVEKVEQRDDAHLVWHENIWGVRREWEAEITDQRPNERIAWKSLSGTQTSGVVTFHALSDRLTRIEVNLDFQPQGLLEKTASGFRMSRRALRSDLMRFKAFIEMGEEETGAWRGRLEEGEVASEAGAEERAEDEAEAPVATEPVEAEPEEEESEEEEPEAEEAEEPQAEEEEEPQAEEEEESEAEEEEEPEAEEAPDEKRSGQRRRRVRRRSPARPTRQRR